MALKNSHAFLLARNVRSCSAENADVAVLARNSGSAAPGRAPRRRRARRMHPALRLQLPDALDVDLAPDALLPPRREADLPCRVAAARDAVDPAEAERLVERLLAGDAGLARADLVEADDLLARLVVVLLEPFRHSAASLEEGRLRSFALRPPSASASGSSNTSSSGSSRSRMTSRSTSSVPTDRRSIRARLTASRLIASAPIAMAPIAKRAERDRAGRAELQRAARHDATSRPRCGAPEG